MLRRRKIKIRWFLIIIVTICICCIVVYKNQYIKHRQFVGKVPKKSLLSVSEVTTPIPLKFKHMTKSMAQLGKMDEVNKHFLLINSVPDSGAEILVFLLEKVQGLNNFKHARLKGARRRSLSQIQQENIVDEIYTIRRNLPIPLSFDSSMYFINFTMFDKQLPTYINLIRHPIAKVMARAVSRKTGTYDSYFINCMTDMKMDCNFKTERPYDLTIPYFCGHDPRCMVLNDKWALHSAKTNVDKYYPVVGVLEELNRTLQVLEHKIPQFFKGAKSIYEDNLLEIYKQKKDPEIPQQVKKNLEETLVAEIEFYEWVKRRLLEV